MVSITILGNPTAWTPARVCRGVNRSYNPKDKEKRRAIIQVKQQYKDKPITEAVSIVIGFFMPIPVSTSKKQRALMLEGKVPHVKKIDIDNACKFAIDILKEIVIQDDNQVVSLSAHKEYSEDPHTRIRIEPYLTSKL